MADEKLIKRVTELEEMNADLKQSLDWANERENENVNLIVNGYSAKDRISSQLIRAE